MDLTVLSQTGGKGGSVIRLLKNRIDLIGVPFTERGSRLLVLRQGMSLQIRMAERWFKRDPALSAYRKRVPILHDFYFTDAEGRRLDFQLESYPDVLEFRTHVGTFRLAYEDMETFFLSLPEVACGICFDVEVDQGQTDRRGGVLRLTGDIRRNIAYTTNRKLLVNRLQVLSREQIRVNLIFEKGPEKGLLLNLTPRLGFNRYMPNEEEVFAAAARRWEEWFAAVPPVAEAYRSQYYYAWWIMRAGLASPRFFTTRESLMPSKMYYVGVWQWDAYFHALAYRHVNPLLARDQIRIFLDHQRPDGMIPDAIHDEGTITHLTIPIEADVTKPPIVSWAVWKLFLSDGDLEFLREIYEPLVRWNNWWFDQNDVDGDGLCEYLHPFSSGLDDNPLWDEGMPVTSPELNTYLVIQMECLSRIAQVLGFEEEAVRWEKRAQSLTAKMVNYLWDEKAGLFWALHDGKPVPTVTPFNLYPLITGRLPPEMAQKLIDHLTNPQEFWTRYPVCTVARNDPKFDPWQMWRGPTWININFLLVEGLERAGFVSLAAELRLKTLELMMGQGDIFEYYNPDTGEPGPKAAPVFGWSAALFIELAIQASARMRV